MSAILFTNDANVFPKCSLFRFPFFRCWCCFRCCCCCCCWFGALNLFSPLTLDDSELKYLVSCELVSVTKQQHFRLPHFTRCRLMSAAPEYCICVSARECVCVCNSNSPYARVRGRYYVCTHSLHICRMPCVRTSYILYTVQARIIHAFEPSPPKKKLQFESFSERTEEWVLSFSFYYYFVCAFFPFLFFDAIEFAAYLVRACFLYANNSDDEIEFRVFFPRPFTVIHC